MATYWRAVRLIQLVFLWCSWTTVSCGAIARISAEDAAIIAKHLIEELGERQLMEDELKAMTKKIETLEDRLDKGILPHSLMF